MKTYFAKMILSRTGLETTTCRCKIKCSFWEITLWEYEIQVQKREKVYESNLGTIGFELSRFWRKDKGI